LVGNGGLRILVSRTLIPTLLPGGEGLRNAHDASEHAALHLVALDALEQGLEVALAEAFVALALDDLEEDRADRVLGEDLQQLALVGLGIGIDEDLVPGQAGHVLAMVGDALVD